MERIGLAQRSVCMTSTDSVRDAVGEVRASEREITISSLRWLDYLMVAALVGVVAWIYMPTFKWWYNVWMAEESS